MTAATAAVAHAAAAADISGAASRVAPASGAATPSPKSVLAGGSGRLP